MQSFVRIEGNTWQRHTFSPIARLMRSTNLTRAEIRWGVFQIDGSTSSVTILLTHHGHKTGFFQDILIDVVNRTADELNPQGAKMRASQQRLNENQYARTMLSGEVSEAITIEGFMGDRLWVFSHARNARQMWVPRG